MEQEAPKPLKPDDADRLVPIIVVPVEFIALLEDEYGIVYLLPQTWAQGREFPAGRFEWDMLVNAVRDLQEQVLGGAE